MKLKVNFVRKISKAVAINEIVFIKNKTIELNIVGEKNNKTNILRKKLDSLLEGVFLTRDLVSEPGNILHPDEYAKRLTKLKKIGLKVTVYD